MAYVTLLFAAAAAGTRSKRGVLYLAGRLFCEQRGKKRSVWNESHARGPLLCGRRTILCVCVCQYCSLVPEKWPRTQQGNEPSVLKAVQKD